MQQPTESELKRALADAGNTEFRLPVALVRSSQFLEHREEASGVIRHLFADAGVDVDRLKKTQTECRAELNRIAGELHRDAVNRSAESRDAVHATLADRRKLIESGRVTPVGIKPEHGPTILDKPFLIQPSHAIVTGEQIAPLDSWAKTEFELRKTGDAESKEESIHFYYRWDNPHAHRVTIDVTTALGFYGFCRVHAEGAFYNATYSSLRVFAALAIRPWSQGPGYVLGDLKDVVEIDATSTSLLDDDTASRLETTQELRSSSHSWVTIEPNELVVFEAAVVFHAHIEGKGSASVDFDEGYFAISSPYLAVGVWTP